MKNIRNWLVTLLAICSSWFCYDSWVLVIINNRFFNRNCFKSFLKLKKLSLAVSHVDTFYDTHRPVSKINIYKCLRNSFENNDQRFHSTKNYYSPGKAANRISLNRELGACNPWHSVCGHNEEYILRWQCVLARAIKTADYRLNSRRFIVPTSRRERHSRSSKRGRPSLVVT